jgi:hypothetical protein
VLGISQKSRENYITRNFMLFIPNSIGVIKLRMRWAEHVERMAERRGSYRILVGKSEGSETSCKTEA